MVCPYCHGNTHVSNTRPQKRSNRLWRRRKCEKCGATFTSLEAIDVASVLRVSHNKRPTLFDKDRLLISIYESCRHRKQAHSDASALAQTVVDTLMRQTTDGILEVDTIRIVTHQTLLHFDPVAAAVYAATHISQAA